MSIKDRVKQIASRPYFDYALIGLASALTGFFRIDYQSLWNDESISIVWAAKKSLQWIWQNVPKTDLHPPLYYSVLHFWQRIFGDSVFFIRGLSALFFIGGCILAYHFIKIIFKKRDVALLTALIYLTNPFAVLYAQEVRSYSMLLFFLLVNSIMYYEIVYLGKENRFKYLGYFISALVLIYTNILALFALFVDFIILIIRKDWRHLRAFVPLFAVLAILYLPALGVIKNANQYDYSYYNSERFGLFLKTVVVIAGFVGGKINIWNGKRHIYGLLAASLGAYASVFSIFVCKIRQVNKYLLSFFLLSFGLILITAHIKFPVPDPKYFYVCFPFFIFLIGNVFALLPNRYKLAVFFIILVFNGIFLYDYYFVKTYEKENWKSVISMVENDYKAEKNKSALSVSPVSEPHTTWQYYSHNIIPAVGALEYGGATTSVFKALDEANTPPKDIIYLSRFIWELFDPPDVILSYFESHGYVKTKVFQDTKVEYWRLDRIKK